MRERACSIFMAVASHMRHFPAGRLRMIHGELSTVTYRTLVHGSLRQRQVIKIKARTKSDQAVGESKLYPLSSVHDLIQRPTCGADLLRQGLPLIDREA